MKKIVTTLILVVLASMLLSTINIQTVKSVDPLSTEWTRTFGSTGDDQAQSVVQTFDGGFALAGRTKSYGAGNFDFWLIKTDVNGNMEWNKTYGGSGLDAAECLVQTSDGGYALTGNTYSFGEGINDFWLVKTDQSGTMEWNKTYGGSSWDYGYSVIQTNDGGYAITGGTYSFGAGDGDFWLVKTDSNGNMEWNQTYGGSSLEGAYDVVQTSDGGYALTGTENSFSGGWTDFWLVKTDTEGNMEWSQSYGGSNYEVGWALVQTSDSGYALAGRTESYGSGPWDAWLVKVNSSGVTQWSRTYGGGNQDEALDVVQTDCGYALTGRTDSFGTGNFDFWVITTDMDGIMKWNQTWGGSNNDLVSSIVETKGHGYCIAGLTQSYGAGSSDAWLVKIGGENLCLLEDVEWCQTYGCTDWEEAWSVIQTDDGGYALAGSIQSYGAGGRDFWLIKTDSAGNMAWDKTFGGTNHDWAYSLQQTSDGGYVLAGETKSLGAGAWDWWIVKTDASGNHQWNQTYGGRSDDAAHSIIEVDEGYVIVGNTNSFGQGSGDIWLVRTDLNGTVTWSQTYGGTGDEDAWSVVETDDSGFAIGGWTESLGGGSRDFWLVKTDSSGLELWSQTYGGSKREHLWSMILTDDGGFALTGSDNYGSTTEDVWVVKTDLSGSEEWNRTYGGSNHDYSHSIIQTLNGDYAIGGWTMSFGEGAQDGWLLRVDSDGDIKGNQTFGGTDMDALFSIIQTDDAGLALTGITLSFGADSADAWLIKLAPPPIQATIDIDPNSLNLRSTGQWITTYIELPEGYDVNNIDVSTLMLNNTVSVDHDAPSAIGDYDEDGTPDLMVKFSRSEVIDFIIGVLGTPSKFTSVTLTITGELDDGTLFEGSDAIKVIYTNARGAGRHTFKR